MGRSQPNRPTDAELEILQVLWDHGRSTVREVHRAINDARPAGYTTVLKLMQIMTDKGLLRVDRSVRPQLYEPARTRKQTQRLLVRDLLDRAFQGSPGRMVLQALSSTPASADERREIRALLDRLEEDQ